MATTIKAGFYGTEDATYYVTESGEIWTVQCDDRDDCPFRYRGTELPEDVEGLDEWISAGDACAYLDAIEAKYA